MGTTITNIIGINPKDLPSDPSFDEARLSMSINPDSGAIYKTTVQDWVDLLIGLGIAYAGPADPTTDPGTPSNPLFYTATTAGTYTNFLDSNGDAIVIDADDSLVILSYNDGSWKKQAINIDLTSYAKQSDVDDIQSIANEASRLANAVYEKDDTNLANNLSTGYIAQSDGHLVTPSENPSGSGWRATDYIPVTGDTEVYRKNAIYTNTGVVAALAFYDETKVFLGFYNLAQYPAEFTITVSDVYSTAKYIRSSFIYGSGANPMVLTTNRLINSDRVAGLIDAQNDITGLASELGLIISDIDHASDDDLIDGYIGTDGNLVTNTAYYTTDYIKIGKGIRIQYKGVTGSLAIPIAGYDDDKAFVQALLVKGTYTELQNITVPDGISFIKFCSSHADGVDYAFIVPGIEKETIIQPELLPDYYMPPKAWAQQGKEFRMNPFGIIAKHPLDRHIDLSWGIQYGNEKFLSYTPGAEDTQSIALNVRDLTGKMVNIGSTEIQVVHTVQSPAVAQNFIALGDSLTQGVNSISGAWVNELSRRLNGVGTELLTGDESPAALALENIYFRGTLGDQPVKHEGRSGWKVTTYLNTASSGGVDNAFWNPTTSEFDLAYYLTQNNFNSDQTTGGVDSTGSNLTMLIFLIWNHVYSDTVAETVGYMKQLIDKIHSQKSAAKIKLLGVPCPAYPNKKSYDGTRNVSVESIMREAVVAYNKGYSSIAEDSAYSSFVEFIPISPFFFPINSFPTAQTTNSFRDSTALTVYTDHVHPVARGYAQIADVVFSNILFNYCKAS